MIFNSEIEIFSTDFIFEELEKHSEYITRKTRRTKQEYEEAIRNFLKKVKIIPAKEYINHSKEAQKITPDQNDFHYFALALHLRCPLWSNDKELKRQDIIKVYSTEELRQMFKQNSLELRFR